MEHVTMQNFEDVMSSEDPVIIDFYADWCGPCQMMAPVFEELSGEYEGKLKFMKLDTQSEGALAAKFGVQGIPALIVLKNGKEVDRIVGFAPKEVLKEKIDEILGR